MHSVVDRARHRVGDAWTEGRTKITRDDLAGSWECRRAAIVPERAGVGESDTLNPRTLGQEEERRLQLKPGPKIVRAAERISKNAGKRKLRQIARPNPRRCKSAHQIGPHLKLVEHPQPAAAAER